MKVGERGTLRETKHNTEKKRQRFNLRDAERKQFCLKPSEQTSLPFEKNTDEFAAAVPSFLMLLLSAVIVSTAAIICYYGEQNQTHTMGSPSA